VILLGLVTEVITFWTGVKHDVTGPICLLCWFFQVEPSTAKAGLESLRGSVPKTACNSFRNKGKNYLFLQFQLHSVATLSCELLGALPCSLCPLTSLITEPTSVGTLDSGSHLILLNSSSLPLLLNLDRFLTVSSSLTKSGVD
jgi:hypothetical protein